MLQSALCLLLVATCFQAQSPSSGGGPLITRGGALFVATSDGDPPRLVGDFNGWGEAGQDTEMARIGANRSFSRFVPLDPAARVEYRVDQAGRATLDPSNPNRVEAFEGQHSEVRMPGYAAPAELELPLPNARGRLVEFRHRSASLKNERLVRVYLPPGYDTDDRVYPSVWLGDGTLFRERLLLPERLDQLIARREIEPLVAIFLDPVERGLEYRAHAGYRRMITEELLPIVERAYRVERVPERRAVAGCSRGGLAALDLALRRPDLFGQIGVIAPALSPLTVTALLTDTDPKTQRFFILGLRYDVRFGADADTLARALATGGAWVDYTVLSEGHTLATWAGRFPELLAMLFPADGAGSLGSERRPIRARFW